MLASFTRIENLPNEIVQIAAGGNHSWAIQDQSHFEKLASVIQNFD
jgi:hypothetical protein